MDIFVARQPILDRRKKVFGYELLFRSGPENLFSFADADLASSRLMDEGLNVIGLDSLTYGRPAFINMTRKLLVADYASLLPHDRTVLEVLETVEPDAEVIAACIMLKQSGYLLALDDFVWRPELDPLVHLANILKIDFQATDSALRGELVRRFAPEGIQMLAEKVETLEEFQEAWSLGYSLFQGYFFCRPEMIMQKDIPGYKLNHLRFLQEFSRPELDMKKLEGILKRELSLAVRLLRYLNSAAFGLRSKVSSLKHALALLGERNLRKWAYLVAMAGLGKDKPEELVITSLFRARFSELIGTEIRSKEMEADLFLVGMLSMMEPLTGRPLPEILEGLSLSEEIKKALLTGGTRLGRALELVTAYERGAWDKIPETAHGVGVQEQRLPVLYRNALDWAREVFAL